MKRAELEKKILELQGKKNCDCGLMRRTTCLAHPVFWLCCVLTGHIGVLTAEVTGLRIQQENRNEVSQQMQQMRRTIEEKASGASDASEKPPGHCQNINFPF